MKRFIYLFIYVAAIIPFTVSRAYAQRVQVGSVLVTTTNCADVLGDGKVSYDFNTNTLTLKNATINASGGNYGIYVYYTDVTSIKLEGNNTITLQNPTENIAGIGSQGSKLMIYSEEEYYPATLTINTGSNVAAPIKVSGDLELSGFMTVELRGMNEKTKNSLSANKLTIDGATLIIGHGENVVTQGITITKSEITSPSGCKLSSDKKSFVKSDGSQLGEATQVTVSTKYRQLIVGVMPKSKGCVVKYNGKETDNTLKTHAVYGTEQVIQATSKDGYLFEGWYQQKGSTASLLTEDPTLKYTMPNESATIYAQYKEDKRIKKDLLYYEVYKVSDLETLSPFLYDRGMSLYGESALVAELVKESETNNYISLPNKVIVPLTLVLEDGVCYVLSIYDAFKNCTKIKDVTIAEGIVYMSGSFNGCTNLTTVTISSTVEYIGWDTFGGCNALKTIYNYSPQPQDIGGTHAFYSFTAPLSQITVYVPHGSKDAYMAAYGWQEMNIVEMEDDTAVETIKSSTSNSKKAIRDGIMYIEKDGKKYNLLGAEVK